MPPEVLGDPSGVAIVGVALFGVLENGGGWSSTIQLAALCAFCAVLLTFLLVFRCLRREGIPRGLVLHFGVLERQEAGAIRLNRTKSVVKGRYNAANRATNCPKLLR